MADNETPQPPAGWYPDPTQPGQQRYWDGAQWTEHTAPGGDAGGTDAGAGSGATSGDASGGWDAGTTGGASGGFSGAGGGFGAGTGGGAYGAAGGGMVGEKPDPWLWQSIVATVLCCLPAGIVGIVFAAKANSAISAGNYAEARENAAKAKTWTLVSAGLGVVVVVFWILALFVGGIGAGIDGGF